MPGDGGNFGLKIAKNCSGSALKRAVNKASKNILGLESSVNDLSDDYLINRTKNALETTLSLIGSKNFLGFQAKIKGAFRCVFYPPPQNI